MDAQPLDVTDGGYGSRKFWLTVGTSCAIFVAGAMAAAWPAFGANLQAVIGGLVASLGVYAGANVTGSWLAGKNMVQHMANQAAVAAVNAPAEDDEFSDDGMCC